MTISRRKFTKLALLGGAAVGASCGIFFPKPAEAFLFPFLLRTLSARAVFGGLVRYAAGRVLRNLSDSSSGVSYEELLAIQLADNDLIERQFTQNKTPVVRASVNLTWGREKQDKWGANVGFGFVQRYQDDISTAKITGPTMVGIHVATQKLAQMRMSPEDIADTLLPVTSQYDDWCSWEGDTFPDTPSNRNVCFSSYTTRLGEVTSTYELIKPGRGGYGNVHLIVESGGEPRRDIMVQVKFA